METRPTPNDHRLVLFHEDVERMDRVLEEFIGLSGAKAVVLVDRSGRVITRRGEELRVDMDTIGALAAGSFAATREMARVLGEERFNCLTHQGTRNHLHLALIGDRTLLTALFDERTTLGMVRFYAGQCTRRLASLFEEMRNRSNPPGEALDAGFGSSASRLLDEVLRG